MSKKKDPNVVSRDAALRANEQTRKRLHKRIPQQPETTYLHRVADEYCDLAEKTYKLEHALWRKENTENTGETIVVYTPFARQLPGKDRQLLVRQRKAMRDYLAILAQRLESYKPGIFAPTK